MWSAFLLFRYAPLQCGLPFVRTTRDRVHAHPAVFCFCVHTFTYPLQSAVSLHIRSEEKAVIYLHLLLHLAQTEGERE